MKQRSHKAAKIKGDAESVAKQLETMTLKIGAKVGEQQDLRFRYRPADRGRWPNTAWTSTAKKVQLDTDHIKTTRYLYRARQPAGDVKAKVNFEVVADNTTWPWPTEPSKGRPLPLKCLPESSVFTADGEVGDSQNPFNAYGHAAASCPSDTGPSNR